MKKNIIPLIFLSACLFAADFWTKPFSEWSDKDARRMMENSPWAKPFSMSNDLPENDSGNGHGLGPISEGPDLGEEEAGAGYGRGHRSKTMDDKTGVVPAAIIVRWQDALPVKEALLRMKYGSEAAGSAEAKKIIGAEDETYKVGVIGVPQRLLTGAPSQVIKRNLIQYSFLSAKGKPDLHPSDIQFGDPSQLVDVYFEFPKKTPFTLDDKNIDFTGKFGKLVIRQSFRLKDMVINGKLAL